MEEACGGQSGLRRGGGLKEEKWDKEVSGVSTRGTVGRRAPCWRETVGWAMVQPEGGAGGVVARRKRDKEISRGIRDNSLEPFS